MRGARTQHPPQRLHCRRPTVLSPLGWAPWVADPGLLPAIVSSRQLELRECTFPVGTLDAMNGALLVLIVLVVAAIGFAVYATSKASGKRNAASLADAKADARRVIERLGGQVLNLTGTDDASKQALADASERYTAASSQIDQATTARQAAAGQGKRDRRPVLRARRAHRDGHGSRAGTGVAGRPAHGGHRHRGPPGGVRGPRDRGVADARRSAPRTTTPADASPAVRCPPAGTPSRGGSRRWSRAPGAWARCCCSAPCSPAWAASATTHRHSRTATATASRMAWTRASRRWRRRRWRRRRR